MRTRLLIVLMLAMAAHGAASQRTARPSVPAAPQQQQPPVFRTKTEIIRIDVTVLGADGRPLKGLTRDDFILLEDGEPQSILGFGEVNIPDASGGPVWLRDSSPDVRTTLDGRVFVFLLDNALASYGLNNDLWLATVKRITDEIIERMGPRDVAAVICTFSDTCDQDFTNDPVRLKAAIARFRAGKTPAAGISGDLAYAVSSGMAQSVTKFLREDTSRRRTLIYVTPELPVRPEIWPPHHWGSRMQQNIRTFEEAARARVVVYGLSLTGLSQLVKEAPAPGEGEDRPGAVNILAPRAAPTPQPTAGPVLFTAPERSLALETGGFWLNRPALFEEGIDQIFRETGSYYMLGFEQPPRKDVGYTMLGGFRAINVLVKRPDAIVKTHKGYAAFDPIQPPKKPTSPATMALSGILPKADLPLRLTLSPFAVPGKSEAVVAIALGVTQPAPSSRTFERIDFQVRAFTQGGKQVAITSQKVDATVPPGRESDVLIEVVSELRLKPGVYSIRAAATSERMGLSGAVYADLEVPDFGGTPVSLSGILLTSSPRPPTAQASPLNAIVPAAPTTLRTFSRTHIVAAVLRVYQSKDAAAQPVTLTMTVLDEAGARVAEQKRTLTADQFARTQSVDINWPIVATEFQPGAHLLRIEVDGANFRRDVQFLVK